MDSKPHMKYGDNSNYGEESQVEDGILARIKVDDFDSDSNDDNNDNDVYHINKSGKRVLYMWMSQSC